MNASRQRRAAEQAPPAAGRTGRPAGRHPEGALPDVRRSGAPHVWVARWRLGEQSGAARTREGLAAWWGSVPWPGGTVSATAYVAEDGDNALGYVRCSAPSPRTADILRAPHGAEAVAYGLRRSVVPETGGVPTCMVAVTFGTAGPRAASDLVGAVAGQLEAAAPECPGLVSAHFHVSLGHDRVLNYAEWESPEAHERFVRGAASRRVKNLVQHLPGVRPFGHLRYHVCRTEER
ncbi:antibiotic biosynthesis monooxygenase family protein [Streptomyces iconiensis]|uniref:Antibiotic biosynthesis monooxygenase n=1 Tax=Streptomyces iconiensis TaxID=1384038 RepID=A0ABT7A0Y8_9ACTN|nr:antibiotic biosynthesis monooxygenase [Streptomyces iconiensis]MDJ1135000.1 antibiotic biosynthesis monooxygenase [Streptomyces iconiensis]